MLHVEIDLGRGPALVTNGEPSSRATTSDTSRRGVDGNGSALTGAHPIRNNLRIPSAPKTSARTAARVSGISNGSVIRQLASPNAVAVSSTRLVASPARSLANVVAAGAQGNDNRVVLGRNHIRR